MIISLQYNTDHVIIPVKRIFQGLFINLCLYSGDELPLLRLHGSELIPEFFNKNGLDTPILVEKKDGMNLTVPPRTFTIQDVENNVGK